MIKFDWRVKTAIGVLVVVTLIGGLSAFFHGGLINQGKQQVLCIRDGMAVDRNSKYEWLLNTCSINRGTEENPNWVISKRDMGLDATDVTDQ